MKLIKSAFIACSIALLTAGCNSNSGLTTATTDDVQQMIDDQQAGFVVITNEMEAPVLDEVEKALLEKKETAMKFNVFGNNGKSENSDGLSKNPFRSEMSHVNILYYVKEGKTYGEYDLETYDGLRQQEELGHFIDSMTRGEANE